MRLLSLVTMLVLILKRPCDGGPPGISGSPDNPKVKAMAEKEAKLYLATFGYMSQPKMLHADTRKSQFPSKDDLKKALLRFQDSFLLYKSGEVDIPTQSKMSEYRCGNKDMSNGEQLPDLPKSGLWRNRTLQWNITSYPLFLTKSHTREACNEAFEKWQQVAEFRFIETKNASKADIVILFDSLPNSFLRVAATSTSPLNSLIVFEQNLLWGLSQPCSKRRLQHNFYRGSIMYPMLKPALVPHGSLDIVPNVDRLSIRKLYGLRNTDEGKSAANHHISKICPEQIDSVIRVTKDEWFVFYEDKVYHIKGRKFVDRGKKIQDVFPKAPRFVNATVTSGNLVLLFVERTIYGYEYDGVTFSEAPHFPKELHERVLFYPQAAFPLTNGSVILLSGNVFATYNVLENLPSFLSDKTRYYPNLPDDLRSGVLQDSQDSSKYWMFDGKTVSDYDMQRKQVLQITLITEFFKCLLTSSYMSKHSNIL
ncbi:hypothetical protein KIN20_016311 [Parelaphostrongylus tenuis]|uniref:Peptidase M10 metallopeptidase domain-containing protein n=1 Tax=Parelaphostrongylus tenuis TaxID=148309 RepID=A0AAD5MH85_PARTN|nr:hypothetical protein KIN20_016311 [Parelaphostrongylus tenuis]